MLQGRGFSYVVDIRGNYPVWTFPGEHKRYTNAMHVLFTRNCSRSEVFQQHRRKRFCSDFVCLLFEPTMDSMGNGLR